MGGGGRGGDGGVWKVVRDSGERCGGEGGGGRDLTTAMGTFKGLKRTSTGFFFPKKMLEIGGMYRFVVLMSY